MNVTTVVSMGMQYIMCGDDSEFLNISRWEFGNVLIAELGMWIFLY
jgi:hypothetical protein